MNKDNYKIYIYCIIGLFLLALGAQLLFAVPQDIKSWIAALSKSLTFVTLVWFVFVKWLWKCRLFHKWLVPFPCLSGKWEGLIKTTYDGNYMEIPTEMTITQTFYHIQVKIKTKESWSESYNANFMRDQNGDVSHLFYTYLNTPNPEVRHRSEIHWGTTRLDFDTYPVFKMAGEYWTTRQSVGRLELKKKL